jgi:hypothetical protein
MGASPEQESIQIGFTQEISLPDKNEISKGGVHQETAKGGLE